MLQIGPETGPMKISSILTLISTKLAVRPHYNSWQFFFLKKKTCVSDTKSGPDEPSLFICRRTFHWGSHTGVPPLGWFLPGGASGVGVMHLSIVVSLYSKSNKQRNSEIWVFSNAEEARIRDQSCPRHKPSSILYCVDNHLKHHHQAQLEGTPYLSPGYFWKHGAVISSHNPDLAWSLYPQHSSILRLNVAWAPMVPWCIFQRLGFRIRGMSSSSNSYAYAMCHTMLCRSNPHPAPGEPLEVEGVLPPEKQPEHCIALLHQWHCGGTVPSWPGEQRVTGWGPALPAVETRHSGGKISLTTIRLLEKGRKLFRFSQQNSRLISVQATSLILKNV